MTITVSPAASWWETINWGSVPDWFAAVGTVGALLATVAIIAREKREQRRASADSLVSWVLTTAQQGEDGQTEFGHAVHLHNVGSQPIPQVMIIRKIGASQKIEMQRLSVVGLSPGQSVSSRVKTSPSTSEPILWLRIQDASGKPWIRDLQTNQYISRRQLRRLSRKHRKNPEAKRDILLAATWYDYKLDPNRKTLRNRITNSRWWQKLFSRKLKHE